MINDKSNEKENIAQLQSEDEYLKQMDPYTYYYREIDKSGNPYLNDKFWNQAKDSDELNTLIHYLQMNKENPMLDKLQSYGDRMTYDQYMYALAYPTLDDTVEKDRTTVLDDGSDYSYGKFTDKKWAEHILNYEMGYFDAEMLEERKRNKSFFENLGGTLLATGGHICGGVLDFFGFFGNIGAGLGAVFTGDSFLAGFTGDDNKTGNVFGQWADRVKEATYRYEIDHGSDWGNDAVKDYEAGGVYGSGYDKAGELTSSISESIGMMIPSMFLTAGIGQVLTKGGTVAMTAKGAVISRGIGTGAFYTAVWSQMIEETVKYNASLGISYRDLNTGQVLANATAKAAAQYAVELLLGKILGFTKVDRLMGVGSNATGKVGARTVTKLGSSVLSAVGRGMKDAVQEGLEEVFQDLSDTIIDVAFGGNYSRNVAENFKAQDLLYSFLAGAISSLAIGSVSNASLIWNREYGTKYDGTSYKMGMFETLNYRDAMRKMSEWRKTAQNENLSDEVRANALFKLQTSSNNIASALRPIGTENTIKGQKVLNETFSDKNMNIRKAMKLNKSEYTDLLVNRLFMSSQLSKADYKLNDKSTGAKIKSVMSKIKNAIIRSSDKLKNGRVTEINEVITDDIVMENDTNNATKSMTEETVKINKKILDTLKSEIICGVDGDVITRSGDVIFVKNELLQAGDFSKILEGLSIENVVGSILPKLGAYNRKRILDIYSKEVSNGSAGKMTASDINVENAVTTMLFNSKFYLKVLLSVHERTRQNGAIEILATIDKLMKGKIQDQIGKKGRIEYAAYKKLLSKVQETMRAGLITYATQYNRIDLGQISNDVLPANIKADIGNHKNVKYSNDIDEALTNAKKSSTSKSEIKKVVDGLLEDLNNQGKSVTDAFSNKKAAKIKGKEKVDDKNTTEILNDLLDKLKQKESQYAGKPLKNAAYNDISINNTVERDLYKKFDSNVETLASILEDKLNLKKDSYAFKLLKIAQLEFRTGDYNYMADAVMTYDYILNEARHRTDVRLDNLYVYLPFSNRETNYLTELENFNELLVGDNAQEIPSFCRINSALIIPAENSANMNKLNAYRQILGTYDFNGLGIDDYYRPYLNSLKYEHINEKYRQDPKISNAIDEGRFNSDLEYKLWALKYLSAKMYMDEKEVDYGDLLIESKRSSKSRLYAALLVGEHGTKKSDGTIQNEPYTLLSPAAKSILERYGISGPDKIIEFNNNYIFRLQALRIVLNQCNPNMTILENGKLAILENSEKVFDETKLSSFITDNWNKAQEALQNKKEGVIYECSLSELAAQSVKSNKGIERHGITSTKIKLIFNEDKRCYGGYRPSNQDIVINVASYLNMDAKQALEFVKDTLTHEFNHLILESGVDEGRIRMSDGGFSNLDYLSKEAKDDVREYINQTFPVYSSMFAKNEFDFELYSFINGELYARQNTLGMNIISGFKERITKHNGRVEKYLVSPDGKRTWKLEMKSGFFESHKESAYMVPKKDQYVSNKDAQESNLKYRIKKGRPIFVSPNVKEFTINTTNDVDKVDKHIRDKILNGTLTTFDVKNYVATARRIGDYTFQAIAKYIYHNDVVAKMTHNDMMTLFNNIQEYAAIAQILKHNDISINEPMTLEKLETIRKTIMQEINNGNTKLANQFNMGMSRARTTLLYTESGIRRIMNDTDLDILQLNPIFFNHYNGSLKSIISIVDLANFSEAHRTTLELISEAVGDNQANTDESSNGMTSGAYNWIDRIKKADIDYEQDENIVEALEDIDIHDKIEAIESFITNSTIARMMKLSEEQKRAQYAEISGEMKREIEALANMSDDEINKLYLSTIINDAPEQAVKNVKDTKTEGPVKPENEEASKKNLKDSIRNSARTITRRVAGMKSLYKLLSDETKAYFDPKTYKIINSTYQNLSYEELVKLKALLQSSARKLGAKLRDTANLIEAKAKFKEKEKKLAEKMKPNPDRKSKTTLKEKVAVKHKVTIKTEKFSFTSDEALPRIVRTLFGTAWDKTRMSKVQALTNNHQQTIANSKTFYETNKDTLLSMSLEDAERVARWFLTAKMNNVNDSDEDYKKYQAIKVYVLSYIYDETRDKGMYSLLNPNTVSKIENALKVEVTGASTTLAVWKNVLAKMKPLETMMRAQLSIDGVMLTDFEKTELVNAAVEGDIDRISKIQDDIISRIDSEKSSKTSFLKRITAFRSMAMLSSPMTALRNKVSNMGLKRYNKISEKIGSWMFKGQTKEGQLKFSKPVTPEIQEFVKHNILDTGLFDELVGNITKYNPSDLQSNAAIKNTDGSINKNAVFANFVIKSMYGKYYTQNMFNSDMLNKAHAFIMKALSDNSYVREACIRYFGKTLAEKGYDLTKGLTDHIMTDFASCVGLAMADYMHSDNFFNSLEKKIAEKSEVGLFVYKMILPYGSSSWNWFKAALKFSPLGLGRALYKLAYLEKSIITAEQNWSTGKSQIAPEFTEYLIRRDLGAGVMGTIGVTLGIMLAAFGIMRLEDDDYGVPKIRIGKLAIDINDVFGSSSILAGAAFMCDVQKEGVSVESLKKGFDDMSSILLDGLFMIELMQLDMYSGKSLSMTFYNLLQNVVLSFIPNGLNYIAGATYGGTLKKNTFFGRLAAKIPFLGPVFNEKKVDPFTGETNNLWTIFNRIVPYFSVENVSSQEKSTVAVGLNKEELTGRYTVNGEPFKLNDKELTVINKMYGEWNAQDLTDFYSNKKSYQVKTENGYKTLTHNKMTTEQRKATAQSIMNGNALRAKIQAWLNAGHKYYASQEEYQTLKKYGIKGKLYIGKGSFVK